MEDELRCVVCKHFFSNPVLMPCYHSVCLNCAINLQQPINLSPTTNNTNANFSSPTNMTPCSNNNNNNNNNSHKITANVTVHSTDNNMQVMMHHCGMINTIDATNMSANSATSSSTGSEIGSDPDKLSLISETDSGVICNTSRPNSYVGTPNLQGFLFPPLLMQSLSVVSLSCPICHKVVYFDENGAHNLPKNRTLQNIVDRYGESKQLATQCQLCEGDTKEATFMCEQCEVFYCSTCKDNCHPMRGPLAKHSLISPQQGKMNLRSNAKRNDYAPKCAEHSDNDLSSFCLVCKIPVCERCIREGRHATHEVQALAALCRSQKTELSQTLQALSEKAKAATEFIQRLKAVTETVNENACRFESEISSQCDLLIQAIQSRKMQLLAFASKERDYKLRVLKDQASTCTEKLQQTTGLIHFCIEAIKETDSTAYLQIGPSLINRVSNVEFTWHRNMNVAPRISPQFDLTLESQSVLQAIEQMTFSQMKPPEPPVLIPEECSSESNSITIAWQPLPSSFAEGFILELDNGNNGNFREVYCGKETICRVDGLHFNSIYRVRVKAFNSSGEGAYSEIISLQTADVAWFLLDVNSPLPDVLISNANQTVTCDSYEHRVILGNIGFSRGIHYWEINIDRYQNNADIAVGVARTGVSKDKMLGKDEFGWSMYIDNKRSWFLHGNHHFHRTEGGIGQDTVVGVLLNLETHQLSFYVNDERQGSVAFNDLKGNFYPAISLNRNVQVTFTTGIDPPSSSGNSFADSETSDEDAKLQN